MCKHVFKFFADSEQALLFMCFRFSDRGLLVDPCSAFNTVEKKGGEIGVSAAEAVRGQSVRLNLRLSAEWKVNEPSGPDGRPSEAMSVFKQSLHGPHVFETADVVTAAHCVFKHKPSGLSAGTENGKG